MSVNGITGASEAYSAYAAQPKTNEAVAATETKETETNKAAESGVVYEPSENVSAAKTYTPDANLIARLKADSEARIAQMQSLVEKMMTKQGQTFSQANDMWSILSSGNFTVDPATKLQAQADIAEDGYWGVSQTSQRILDFASALTGGDPDKIEDMRSAFQKGYEQAEKTWGGKLPDISQKTYDAVMKGFDELAKNTEAVAESQTITE